jgi:hypothetical protein
MRRLSPFLGRLLTVIIVLALLWLVSGRPRSMSEWWQARSDFTNRYPRPAGFVAAALLAFYLIFFSISAITYKRRGYDPMGSGCLWTMAGAVAVLGAILGLGFALRLNWLIAFASVMTIGPTIWIVLGFIAEGFKAVRKKWTQNG